jgi:hypothetical protein
MKGVLRSGRVAVSSFIRWVDRTPFFWESPETGAA